MKKLYGVALAAAMLSGLGLIAPGISSAATVCAGPLGPGVIPGNLTVAGGNCVLYPGTTVTGSITLAGGTLTMNGATVNGSVTQTGGTLVSQGSTIRGSLTVKGVAPDSRNDICGGAINGSVAVNGVTGPADGWFRLLGGGAFVPVTPCMGPIGPLTVGGSVKMTNNNIYVRVSGVTVRGSVSFNGDTSTAYDPPAPHAGDVSVDSIRGSLSCSNNTNGLTGTGTNSVTGARTGQCVGF